MSITAFPKIFHIGTDYIKDVFNGPVEITEKIDGSQFIFGKVNGELFMRSKGAMIYDFHDRKETDLFYPIIQHVLSIEHKIKDNLVLYGETLCRPKHNTLKYSRVPKNNFMLFGVSTPAKSFTQSYADLAMWAEHLNVEVVPLVYQGSVEDVLKIYDLMDTESVLGNTKMEGIVVKNYGQPFLLGGQPIPVMCGKYVSEAFKEVHRSTWNKENTGVGRWQAFKEGYKTEARWEKAIQHLAETGELENQPRDIGKLLVEIKRDITEEEKDTIKNFLWKEFGTEVLRTSCFGFPEWYKNKLLEKAFKEGPDVSDGHDCEGFVGGCERFGCPGGEECTAIERGFIQDA